jgi:hypothetical protein
MAPRCQIITFDVSGYEENQGTQHLSRKAIILSARPLKS